MFAFSVTTHGFNKLPEIPRALGLPLMQIGEAILRSIRIRVQRGVSPSGGMWRPIGSDFNGRDGDPTLRWWVAPGQPAHDGWLFKINSGEFAGWTVYEDYVQYLRHLPGGTTRRWLKTGKFWESTGVKYINAKRIKVSSFGIRKSRSGTIANGQVGYLAGRNEQYNVFEPSAAERDAARAMAQQFLTEQIKTAIGIVAMQQDKVKRAGALNRRASKLLKAGV